MGASPPLAEVPFDLQISGQQASRALCCEWTFFWAFDVRFYAP